MRSSVRLNGLLGRGARVSDYDARRLAAEASLQPHQPPPPPFDVSTLPAIQQAALMQMHESAVSRSLTARLLSDSQDGLHAADFISLRELGLAERPEGYRLNKLTSSGVAAAKLLQKKLCMTFGIHLLIEGGASGWQVHYGCPCGFSTMVRRSTTAHGNAAIQHGTYVRTQQRIAGLAEALKPPARAEG